MQRTGTACLLVAMAAAPCLWDSDTIDDELRGLPDALPLITGRWYRHGEAYYRERVQRLAALSEPSLDQLDDLAVAWEKLGDHARAIAVMAAKRAALDARPDVEHEYRYHANSGRSWHTADATARPSPSSSGLSRSTPMRTSAASASSST